MRVVVATASLLAALAAATPAWAKEPISATFCGASDCRTVEDRATLNMIPGGEGTVPLGRAVPYYRVQIVAGERGNPQNQHSFFTYYVPSANAMAFEEPEGVMRYHPIFGAPTINLMRRLTRGLEPFAPPVVTRASVGERVVTGEAARSYLELFETLPEAPLAESPNDWIYIDLRSTRPSPWTDGNIDLVYSPGENLLERGWTRVQVPDAVAEDVEAARAIDASASKRFPWAMLGLSALGAVFLASLRRR